MSEHVPLYLSVETWLLSRRMAALAASISDAPLPPLPFPSLASPYLTFLSLPRPVMISMWICQLPGWNRPPNATCSPLHFKHRPALEYIFLNLDQSFSGKRRTPSKAQFRGASRTVRMSREWTCRGWEVRSSSPGARGAGIQRRHPYSAGACEVSAQSAAGLRSLFGCMSWRSHPSG